MYQCEAYARCVWACAPCVTSRVLAPLGRVCVMRDLGVGAVPPAHPHCRLRPSDLLPACSQPLPTNHSQSATQPASVKEHPAYATCTSLCRHRSILVPAVATPCAPPRAAQGCPRCWSTTPPGRACWACHGHTKHEVDRATIVYDEQVCCSVQHTKSLRIRPQEGGRWLANTWQIRVDVQCMQAGRQVKCCEEAAAAEEKCHNALPGSRCSNSNLGPLAACGLLWRTVCITKKTIQATTLSWYRSAVTWPAKISHPRRALSIRQTAVCPSRPFESILSRCDRHAHKPAKACR